MRLPGNRQCSVPKLTIMVLVLHFAVLTSLLLGHVTRGVIAVDPNDETAAKAFLNDFDRKYEEIYNPLSKASWAAKTNITDYNNKKYLEMKSKFAAFEKEMRKMALQFNASAMSEDTKRQLTKIKDIGVSALSDVKKLDERDECISKMSLIYSTAEVCLPGDKGGKCLPMDPDLTDIMANSRDYDELKAAWTGWRNATGPKMKESFIKYVEISNEAVRELGYKDYGDNWRSDYETPTFEEDVMALFVQVRPLYEQLHAYVRKRLKEKYGEDKFPASGHIPAHLLGNMWAQHWETILDLVIPYPHNSFPMVTKALLDQNYSVTKMFHTAEDFFESIGFDPMVPTFWNLSMLEKPKDGREVVCHGSAWDFQDGKDFRIKMCTSITEDDFNTIHHEMGHVQYYMHYKDQPHVYRSGANPGFHEAVGDTMALSVQTLEHMHKLGFLKTPPDNSNNESDINFLMTAALKKVAFLPFGYLIDQWRWSVFRGDTTPENYNKDWWMFRCGYQGLSPPVPRSEDDFDPGAKYHVPNGTPYIRYFVSFIIQFQFHKAACDAAGHTGPYHRCDIYNSTEAGKLIGDMLAMGASKPWPEAMKKITGQEKMGAGPLLDYFKPLLDFLRKENGNDYGWAPMCPEGSIVHTHANADANDNTNKVDHENNAGERPYVSGLTALIVALITSLPILK